jgi:hypothetical protein
MDRDHFEAGLDRLISAHDRKVCAEIDAGACRTSSDYARMHRARDAYEEAREAFLDEVFALPPPAPPVVVGCEEQVRGRTRGRPLVWHRWIKIVIEWRGVFYRFTADADSLTLDSGAAAAAGLHSPDFDPLCGGHSVHFRGVDYTTSDPGPAELVKLATETCRAVALRLHAHGIDHFTVTRPWPERMPAFDEMVRDPPSQESAA